MTSPSTTSPETASPKYTSARTTAVWTGIVFGSPLLIVGIVALLARALAQFI